MLETGDNSGGHLGAAFSLGGAERPLSATSSAAVTYVVAARAVAVIVDDEALIRMVAADLLTGYGIRSQLRNGAGAIAVFALIPISRCS